jgi:hypothetical protein
VAVSVVTGDVVTMGDVVSSGDALLVGDAFAADVSSATAQRPEEALTLKRPVH